MSKKVFVHLLRTPEPKIISFFKNLLKTNVHLTTGAEISHPENIELLITGKLTKDQIISTPKLKKLIIPWAGLPIGIRNLIKEFPQIEVHNIHHNASQTSELAIALLLSAAKLIIPADHELRQNNWTPRFQSESIYQLNGKTALILGYGSVGKRVAIFCAALGMKINAIRRTIIKSTQIGNVEIFPADSLCHLLPKTNVVIVSLPLTDATRGFLGQRELALLPEQSILINIGRGDIVDEEALFQALKSNKLHSAGLDVWYNYPPDSKSVSNTQPSSFPFNEQNNVVMSPHRGGSFGSEETERSRMSCLGELINAFADGKPMPNQIDLNAGY